MKNHEEYMKEAISLSIESINEGGGPFAAVIVDLDTREIIGRGKNRVVLHSDPTAHGEIEAIRNACKNTGRTELSNCVLYSSAEPCPGCLVEVIFNAGIKEIYYGNSIKDAADVGFADDRNWEALETNPCEIVEKVNGTIKQILRDEAQVGFKIWQDRQDKIDYYSV